jgi:molybdopterin adenylyltransferase
MTLPEKFQVLVITLSDRASKGEYEDLSGPAVLKHVNDFMKMTGWEFNTTILVIPDDADKLYEIVKSKTPQTDIIFTTGGTGIGPRDITVDTIKPMLSKEIPGIMELIRVKYGMQKPNALISRSIAGIIGKTLIYTLPGSVKAVDEYMSEITKTIEHTLYMLYGLDKHK